MTRAVHGTSRSPQRRRVNPTTVRTCLGLLGLFPIASMALTSLVGNAAAAVALASIGAVTLMAILPHGDARE